MRRFTLLLAILAGCSHNIRGITSDAVLGRVVIYRNGVAFYERTARVVDGRVSVLVPRDRVDDFLKSLTVVDPTTRKRLSISIPRQQSESGNYLTMSLETEDKAQTEVLLTYVTESPAWKPSYRIVVGGKDKVMLEGWAIVDNVSGEDWKGVLVGVGASSALSFRYDLWSVVRVDRDLLANDIGFAVAPPTGMSPYAGGDGDTEEIATLDGNAFSGTTSTENRYAGDGTGLQGVVADSKTGEKLPGVTVVVTSPALPQAQSAITDDNGYYQLPGLPAGRYTVTFYYGNVTLERTNIAVAKNRTTPVYQKINAGIAGSESVAIRDTAPTIDPTSTATGVTIDKDMIQNSPRPGRTFQGVLGSAAGSHNDGVSGPPAPRAADIQRATDTRLKEAAERVLRDRKNVIIEVGGLTEADALRRGDEVKSRLIDDGIPSTRISVRPQVGGHNNVRILAIAPAGGSAGSAPPAAGGARGAMPDTPVGESHFMAERPMNVRAGTSAMVSMVQSETKGGIVYLYDPLSDRGDERFAFKSVRLDNPTDDTLEPGPVTVYGDGRFIGEGITEPVPPKASVVVPFALDRQIMIARNDEESDHVAKLITVERGIVTAEVQHRRDMRFTVTSRLRTPTKVYLRHRLQSGWSLVDAPPRHMTVGDSKLFEVELAPQETKYVTISEATPIQRKLDLSAEHPLEMMKLFVGDPAASPKLRGQITALLAIHRESADHVDKITTLREQAAEYRQRTGELHAQLVTLKAVRTGGELIGQLKQRLAEMNDRMQKTTIAIVDTQEKLMLARVKFQNHLADLRLTDVTEAVTKR